ncbi:MAG: 6-phosphogluconolactonase [Anaerolineae bacterium]|nr:6-phosphogluconolactonase [Anaerolineae bacterium]
MSNVMIFTDRAGFVQGAADFVVEMMEKAVAENGRFTLALAGGGTPRPIYALLGTAVYANRIPWDKVHIFFGDERCVPPDDARSNFRMAQEALFDLVPLPASNIYRIHGEENPAQAALAYEQAIQRFFRSATPPPFDLICLGMGENGHTASLFPGTAVLRENKRWVVPQYVETMSSWRVTFTRPLINAAQNVAFLVEGSGKAEMVWRVLKGPYEPDVLPAQFIQPQDGRLYWLLDAAAGAKIQQEGA